MSLSRKRLPLFFKILIPSFFLTYLISNLWLHIEIDKIVQRKTGIAEFGTGIKGDGDIDFCRQIDSYSVREMCMVEEKPFDPDVHISRLQIPFLLISLVFSVFAAYTIAKDPEI